MKKIIALLLVSLLIFSFAANVSAEETKEISFANYTTKQIVEMYSDVSEVIINGYISLSEKIYISEYKIPKSVISILCRSILFENSQIFYVDACYLKYGYSQATESIVYIVPKYLYDKDEIPKKIEEFESAVEFYLKGADNNWNDFTKARYIHEKIVQACQYYEDYATNEKPSIFNAYGALVEGEVVCQGYALAYNYLLSLLDIEAIYVEADTIDHGWSMVKINGNYYHVDITWDDPLQDELGRVCHNYFLLSDEAILAKRPQYTWISSVKATDTSYDNLWWKYINSAIYTIGNKDYYVNDYVSNPEILCYDNDTEMTTVAFSVNDKWYYNEQKTMSWSYGFTKLTYDGKYLYFNGPNKIYYFAPEEDTLKIYYERPQNKTSYISGITMLSDNNFYLNCQDCKASLQSYFSLSDSGNNSLKDINLDGKINIRDATWLQLYISKSIKFNIKESASADVNNDGIVNISDVTYFQKNIFKCS